MKLISLYIENFGKLSNFKYSFNDDMNVIIEENGYGKTTITNFIKAMLYGFTGNKRSLENERLKYKPWNGLTFGGSLDIMINNKKYRIERTFSNHEADDVFKLFDLNTNKESHDYSSNIGEEILKLNAQSFEKSVFLPERELDMTFDEDIQNELANLVGGTIDTKDAGVANDLIVEKYKSIKANGKKGLYYETEDKISRIENNLKELASNQVAIKELENNKSVCLYEINKVTNEINKLSLLQKNYSNIKAKQTNQILLDEKKKVLNEKKKDYEKSLLVLNNNTTSLEEINKYENLIGEAYQIDNNLKSLNERILKYKDINDNIITNEEIIKLEKMVKENNESVHNGSKTMSKPVIISIIMLLVVCLIVGIVVSITTTNIGIIGVFISLIGFVLLMINISNHSNKASENDNEQLRELFGKYQLYKNSFTDNLNELKLKQRELNNAIEEKNNLTNEIKDVTLSLTKTRESIEEFLNKFNLTSPKYLDKISELKIAFNNQSVMLEQINSKTKEIDEFIKNNNLDTVEDISFIDYEANEASINKANNQLSELKININNIDNQIERLNNELYKNDEFQTELEEVKLELVNLDKKYKLLKATSSFILKASDDIKAKYVKPMKDNVKKYLDILTSNQIKEISISTEFDFHIMENGKAKEIGYYSKGYQKLIALCLRLSLIDCLYKESSPFIILDDPFVNLDESKLELALKLIKDVSNKYQIIYFTCHESRSL